MPEGTPSLWYCVDLLCFLPNDTYKKRVSRNGWPAVFAEELVKGHLLDECFTVLVEDPAVGIRGINLDCVVLPDHVYIGSSPVLNLIQDGDLDRAIIQCVRHFTDADEDTIRKLIQYAEVDVASL